MNIENIKENYQNLNNEDSRIIVALIDYLIQQQKDINENYIDSVYEILKNQKDVIIYSSFYQDYKDYFLTIFIRVFLHRKKILCLVKDEVVKDSVTQFFVELFHQIDDIYKVGLDLDIIASTFIDEINETYQFCLLIEPSSFIDQTQYDFSFLTIEGSYLIFDNYYQGLVDILSQCLKRELHTVFVNDETFDNKLHILDVEDGINRVSTNTGILSEGAEIAALLKEKGCNDVQYVSNGVITSKEVGMNISINSSEVNKIHPKFAGNALETEVSDALIIEDYLHNPYSEYNIYKTRARNLLTICSSSFLLKDYMIDNHLLFLKDRQAIAPYSVEYVNNIERVVYELYQLLRRKKNVYYKEIIQLIGKQDSLEEKVRELLDFYLPYLQYDLKYSLGYFTFTSQPLFEKEELIDESTYEENRIITLFPYEKYNYLIDSYIHINGKNYLVTDLEHNKVILKRNNKNLTRKYYRKLSSFLIDDMKKTVIRKKGLYSFEEGYANITISHYGFIEMKNYMDFSNLPIIHTYNSDTKKYTYSLLNKRILKIHFDCEEKVRQTITFLLNEVILSLVPENKVQFVTHNTMPEGLLAKCNLDDIYLIELSPLSLGYLDAIKNNFDDLLYLIEDYLYWYSHLDEWSEQPSQSKSSEVIIEDKQEEKEYKKKTFHQRFFLNLGKDRLDECFKLEDTYHFLEGYLDSILHQKRLETISSSDQTALPGQYLFCSFCNSKIKLGEKYFRLNDGRCRCEKCSQDIIRDDEYDELFNDTLKEYCELFDVTFGKKPEVAIISGKEIYKRNGKQWDPKNRSRITGLESGNQIFIESGAPKRNITATLVHEITHVYDYHSIHLPIDNDPIVEGLAMFMEIQYLYMTDPQYASEIENSTMQRDDQYGNGFKLYLKKYKLYKKNNPINRWKLKHDNPLKSAVKAFDLKIENSN